MKFYRITSKLAVFRKFLIFSFNTLSRTSLIYIVLMMIQQKYVKKLQIFKEIKAFWLNIGISSLQMSCLQ